jgi:hypothetical protein
MGGGTELKPGINPKYACCGAVAILESSKRLSSYQWL